MSDVDILELWLKGVMQNRWFISISLEKNPKSACDEDTAVVAILIQKLQNAASVESFPVVLSNSSSTFKALTRLPKLQFRREEEEKSLADFSSNIVVINLLENLAAMKEFLWTRIQLLDSAEELTSSSSAS